MQNDLISRSAVEQAIKDFNKRRVDRIPKGLPHDTHSNICETIINENVELLDSISKLPTAYNLEKVVEELEDIKGYACMEMDCEKCKYTAMCFEGERSEHVAIDKAIKAVRKGGVE